MFKFNTYIIDRTSNKRYASFSDLFNHKDLPKKKVYYKHGSGIYEGTFNNLFFNYYHDEINKIRDEIIFTGSSSNSISTLIYNMKQPFNFLNLLQKTNINDESSVKEVVSIFFNYLLNNFSIDDVYVKDLFIPVFSINNILKKEIDFIFYTNFQTMDDLINCLKASTFIPKITNNKMYFFYDNKGVLDPDTLLLINFKIDMVNYNFDEISLFNYCFNLSPFSRYYWIMKLTFELIKFNPSFKTNIKTNILKCYDIIKKIDLEF
jgi:hypothetical protein